MTTTYNATATGLTADRRTAISDEARYQNRTHLAHMNSRLDPDRDTCSTCLVQRTAGGTGVDSVDLLVALTEAEAELARMDDHEIRLANAIAKSPHEDWCARSSDACSCWKRRVQTIIDGP